jgi:Fe2+ transport system protein B
MALGYPVYSRITKNSSTALYVVSVVPRTVVAGHGMRFLLGTPLIWTLLFAAFLSVAQLVYRAVDVRSSYVEDPTLNQTIATYLDSLPVIASIIVVLVVLGLHEVLSAAGLYNIFYPYTSLRPIAGGEPPGPLR